jgi:hypothetical protein
VGSILEVVVILVEGFPTVFVYELNQQFTDINKCCIISIEIFGLLYVLMLLVRRIREQNAVASICLPPQLILVCDVKL